jgi:histidine triad (HIT) family protein
VTVFEHLIAGDIPASFVHRDADCVAFMDIRPISAGHVLVVPHSPVATLAELDEANNAHLWRIAQRVALAQQQALGSRAQHFLVNDGAAASQSVPHVHIHVIPRYGRDSARSMARLAWHLTTLMLPYRDTPAKRARLDALAAAIAGAIGP